MPDNTKEPIKEQATPVVEPKKEVIKEKVNKEVVTPEKKEEEFKPIEIPSEDYKTSPLFYEVANFFNIEAKQYSQAADKLSVITDWAIEEANSNKLHDILPVIRQLENKIMKPNWGETRYGNLYRYLRLSMKRDAWNKALKSFEIMGGKK